MMTREYIAFKNETLPTILVRRYNAFLRINRTIVLGDRQARSVNEDDHKGRKGKYRQDCMIAGGP